MAPGGSEAGSDFLVHVNVLARLFRGKMLAMLTEAHAQGRLLLLGHLAGLADRRIFKRFLGSVRHSKWIVYCKAPFAGPEAVLRYLARYTHRVAISNRRLVAADNGGVAFRWKDYRIEGPGRWKTMTLAAHEFIRRFLLHVLPKGFHRIRHYGLLANGNRAAAIAKARELLECPPPPPEPGRPLRHLPMSRARCRAPVPAAADACTSSRRSRRGRCPGTDRRQRSPSGSTRHEPCRPSALRNPTLGCPGR